LLGTGALVDVTQPLELSRARVLVKHRALGLDCTRGLSNTCASHDIDRTRSTAGTLLGHTRSGVDLRISVGSELDAGDGSGGTSEVRVLVLVYLSALCAASSGARVAELLKATATRCVLACT